jgi:hypothetical protein
LYDLKDFITSTYFDLAFGGGGGGGAAGFFTVITGRLRPFFRALPFLPFCTYVVINGCGSLRFIVITSY